MAPLTALLAGLSSRGGGDDGSETGGGEPKGPIVIGGALVVGGLYSLTGAVLGSIAVAAINEVFAQLQNGNLAGLHVGFPDGVANAIIALLVFAILVIRPAGLAQGRDVPVPPVLRRIEARLRGRRSASSRQATQN